MLNTKKDIYLYIHEHICMDTCILKTQVHTYVYLYV